jgi:hypothetical protein
VPRSDASSTPGRKASIESAIPRSIDERAAGVADVPMAFEVNEGQTDERVRFVARGRGYAVFLTDEDLVLSLAPDGEKGRRAALSLRCAGARDSIRLAGERPLESRSNYLGGNDPSKWHTNVQSFGQVRARSVYPGVDNVRNLCGRRHHGRYVQADRRESEHLLRSLGVSRRGNRKGSLGNANSVQYIRGRSLVTADTDDPRVAMNANLNYASNTGTVTVTNRATGARHTLRDRNLSNPPCP